MLASHSNPYPEISHTALHAHIFKFENGKPLPDSGLLTINGALVILKKATMDFESKDHTLCEISSEMMIYSDELTRLACYDWSGISWY